MSSYSSSLVIKNILSQRMKTTKNNKPSTSITFSSSNISSSSLIPSLTTTNTLRLEGTKQSSNATIPRRLENINDYDEEKIAYETFERENYIAEEARIAKAADVRNYLHDVFRRFILLFL